MTTDSTKSHLMQVLMVPHLDGVSVFV